MTNTESTPGDHALALVDKSSTHQFIDNPDIVLELCKQLYRLRWKKSLLAFGSACTALFELAMDVLWRSLRSLVDLLKVIPNFVQVNGKFVCYSNSGNDSKIAHLIVECRQSRACSRIASCPDSTCMLGEFEFCRWILFSQRFA